jgi:hypothetical protein
VRRASLLALACAVLAGCGGGDKAVAHVGGEPVTEEQLDAVVAHFRNEARREGKRFPEEGSPAFRLTRNRLLGLLVYRTELEQAARRLGVAVSDDDVSRRLPAAQSGEEGDARREGSDPGRAERAAKPGDGRVRIAATTRDEGALRARVRPGLVAPPSTP